MTSTSPVDATFAPSFLSENRIILLYPGRPSRCPLQHCPEGFTTFDTLTGTMTSIHRHLHESHRIKADKFWRCSICGQEDTGLRMNGHYKRCLRIQNASISEPQSPSRSESPTLLSPWTTVTHETRMTTTPPQLPGPDSEVLLAPARPQSRAQSPFSPSTRSHSIQSMEDHLPSELIPETVIPDRPSNSPFVTIHETPRPENFETVPLPASPIFIPETQTTPISTTFTHPYSTSAVFSNIGQALRIEDTPSNAVAAKAASQEIPSITVQSPQFIPETQLMEPSAPHSAASVLPAGVSDHDGSPTDGPPTDGPRENIFYRLWAGPISNCKTLHDFNIILLRCSSDWLAKASFQNTANQSFPPVTPTTPRRTLLLERKSRNQSRQQQRLRHRRKFDSHAASRLQRMFRTYPRRAVRHILGENSVPYSGSTQEARAFFEDALLGSSPPTANHRSAASLFSDCCWSTPDAEQLSLLSSPPSQEEIYRKLAGATNTAAGPDGLEYRHLRALDPSGHLLALIYSQAWALGIPDAWKSSRTVLIHKKGAPEDITNFRPISLLSTIYKIFSGIISQRLASIAVDLAWISPEQKGFLPGVHGIQEHTHLLQAAVEKAKFKKLDLSITWLDLSNAFGSVPHRVLFDLIDSLPIPDVLARILNDIYQKNTLTIEFGSETLSITPSSGVRQGDALSTTVFNLVMEPIIRLATSDDNPGFPLCGASIKSTIYADDISIVSTSGDQVLLNNLTRTAACLGLKFNSRKCSNLFLKHGRVALQPLNISGEGIRSLDEFDQEKYLGVPIGARLRYRPPTSLINLLDKTRDSLLAPYQKLEVYRAHLLPSLCHHLASGRCSKETLESLDLECRKFLKSITDLPPQETDAFFYADRSLGGLGTFRLSDEADIWTVARATQLLTSKDPTVSTICRAQLEDTIKRCFSLEAPDPLPLGPYLSGSTDDGLYRLRFAKAGLNLWTLTRRAAKRIGAQIDVSSDYKISIIADDVSVRPLKAVRGLRTAVRQYWSKKLLDSPHQGRIARGLALDNSKDMAELISCRTVLPIKDWRAVHQARLDILPLRGYPWSCTPSKACRRCGQSPENGFHVLNHCRVSLPLKTKRHNNVQDILVRLLLKSGIAPTTNRAPPGQRLIPDVQFSIAGTRVVIDITIPYDTPENLDAAHNRKTEKYSSMGKVLPLVVGSLGSWHPRNNDIRSLLGIDGRSWTSFRRACRISAISGSMDIIRSHVRPSEPADQTPVAV